MDVVQNSGHFLLVGGAGGIGSASCRELLEHGHRVTVIDAEQANLDQLAAAVASDRLVTIAADALNPSTLVRLVADVSGIAPISGFAYLIGKGRFGPVWDMQDGDLDLMLHANLSMQLLWAREVALAMKGSGGSIVLIGSIFGEGSSANRVLYGMVRGGLKQLVRGLAVEWAPHAIRVNAVAPGWTDTPPLRAMGFDLDRFVRRVPMGRLGRPEDIAGPLRFLLTEQSAWVTGVTLLVDGGTTAYLGPGDPADAWPEVSR